MDCFKEYREKLDSEVWFNMPESVKIKENRVVVKIKNNDGSFNKSAIIPTNYYPLNKNTFKVFNYKNTKQITDKTIEKIFDSITYEVGRCYRNSQTLVDKLKGKGYDAKNYVGWLFVSDMNYPTHHSWCVLNDAVLDLTDDLISVSMFFKESKDETIEKQREKMIEYRELSKDILNTQRCYPIGQCSPNLLYIGCECSAGEGRQIYRDLIKKYPYHDCNEGCNNLGLTKTQQLMKGKGLL